MKPLIVGLTGSIGMGKSTVAEHLRSHLGFRVHDADAAVHMLYRAGGAAVQPIAALFGEECIARDGSVCRSSLSRALRDGPADGSLWAALERVVHPLVLADRSRFVADATDAGEWLVVLDVPLLLEQHATTAAADETQRGGVDDGVDVVVVVSAPSDVQRARVLARPEMSAEKFEAILARQMPDAAKRAAADYVVETGHVSYAPARNQVAGLVAQLFARTRQHRHRQSSRGAPSSEPSSEPSDARGGVTFDLDATLWPTMPPIIAGNAALDRWMVREMPRSAAARHDAPPLAAPLPDPRTAHDLSEVRRRALAHLALAWGDSDDEASARLLAQRGVDAFVAARSTAAARTHLHADVLPALRALTQRGLVLGAITDGNAEPVGVLAPPWRGDGRASAAAAEEGGGDGAGAAKTFFKFWIRAEEIGAAKPSAAPFAAAAQRAGLPLQRIVHVGDSLAKDVVGALDAGM